MEYGAFEQCLITAELQLLTCMSTGPVDHSMTGGHLLVRSLCMYLVHTQGSFSNVGILGSHDLDSPGPKMRSQSKTTASVAVTVLPFSPKVITNFNICNGLD